MLRRGDILQGRLVILDKIGSGGYGTVYRARDRLRHRVVAIKVLRPDLADDQDYVRRFRREAQIAELLDSRHIVKVLSSDHTRISNEDIYFQVMEHVEGFTLQQLLRERGRLSASEALAIAVQVARATEEAQDKGVVHRDIKPKNIFISQDETVRLGDFGIARAVDFPSLRPDDPILGTPAYMSPEQCMGKREEIDIRSDLYSLGVVLYEMIGGHPPFEGESASAVCYKHVHESPLPLRRLVSSVPPEVDNLVERCLRKSPADRFQSPRELRHAIERILRPESEREKVYALEETQPLPEPVQRLALAQGFLAVATPLSRMVRGACSSLARAPVGAILALWRGMRLATGQVLTATQALVSLPLCVANRVTSAAREGLIFSRKLVGLPPRVPPTIFAALAGWWRRPDLRFAVGILSAVGGAAALAVTAFIVTIGGESPGGWEPTATPTPVPNACQPEVPGEPTFGAERIAYVDPDGKLAVMNPDGSDKQELTSVGRTSHPAWSADGRRLVFVYQSKGTDGDGPTELRAMNNDGGGECVALAPLAYTYGGEQRHATYLSPKWSSDASAIFYVEYRPGPETFIIRAHQLGSNTDPSADQQVIDPTILFGSGAMATCLDAYHGDGRIVYQACRDGCGLAVKAEVDPPGGGYRLIDMEPDKYFGLPVWSPGGQQVAFYAYIGETTGLVMTASVDPEASPAEPVRLVSAVPHSCASAGQVCPTLAWSPAGGKILYESNDKIWEVDVLSGQSIQLVPGRYAAWYGRACPQNAWKAEYFDNSSLSGNPVASECAEAIDYNWGYDAPSGIAVSPDDFSVRWTGTFDFPETATYVLSVFADDGMRLWVDDQLVLDVWYPQQASHEREMELDKGAHVIKVEYYDALEDAIARVSWREIGSPSEARATPTGVSMTRAGVWVEVFGTRACLQLRESPSPAAPVRACREDGFVGYVEDGPVEADGYQWWKIRDEGWAAGPWLRYHQE